MRRWPTKGLRYRSIRFWNQDEPGLNTKRTYFKGSRPSVAEILNAPVTSLEHQQVEVNGFIRSLRIQKNKAFAAISDGSSSVPLQAVLDPQQVSNLSTGAAVNLKGVWTPSRNPLKQAAELQVAEVVQVAKNDASANPIQKKFQTAEYLRHFPHLRPRLPLNALLLRLRSQTISSISRFFEEQGYVQTHTPIITSSDCEGAGEVFEVHEQGLNDTRSQSESEEFFGAPKYLTVSSQLHLEALAQSITKVWSLSPTFRAEKSDTARHLSEFYMLEAEEHFVEKHDDIMDVVQLLILHVVQELSSSKLGQELESYRSTYNEQLESATQQVNLRARWNNLVHAPWPRITYHQAVQKLQEASATGKATFQTLADDDSGLQTEHERFLADDIGEGGPVFVTDYPKTIKPFYMAPSNSESMDLGLVETVACFDLLFPEVCEVVGGSLREHRLDVLENSMKSKGLIKSPTPHKTTSHEGQEGGRTTTSSLPNAGLEWYLDLRRYGSAPHGGFGLGFDRLLAYLAGIKNVRDVVTFPRWHGRCIC